MRLIMKVGYNEILFPPGTDISMAFGIMSEGRVVGLEYDRYKDREDKEISFHLLRNDDPRLPENQEPEPTDPEEAVA